MTTLTKIPLEQKPIRKAKVQATEKIKTYYKPKRVLQTIIEDDEASNSRKLFKDDNNNSNKLHSKDLQNKSKKIVETPSSVKVEKFNSLLKLAHEQNAKKKGLLPQLILEDIGMAIGRPISKSTPIKIMDSLVSSTCDETEYGFDVLQTDDSTDEEELQTNLPYWTLAQNRMAIVVDQTNIKSEVVDTFFNLEPQIIDLVQIFKNQKPMVRRRSTALWNSPMLRYSKMQKH